MGMYDSAHRSFFFFHSGICLKILLIDIVCTFLDCNIIVIKDIPQPGPFHSKKINK